MRIGLLLMALLLCVSGSEVKLGKVLTLAEPQPIDQVNRNAERLVGKTVQVKGKVTEVCQKMGCWMALADPATTALIRIKVNDGEIVFPKEAIGRMAIAEGRLTKLQLSRQQAVARARHEAEEQSREFDPASVRRGAVIYQIAGTGAVLLD